MTCINLYKMVACFSLLSLWGCELTSDLGGTEAGNPPVTTRQLTGNVASEESDSSDSSELRLNFIATTTVSCVADTVIATDSSAAKTQAEIESDCSFTIELVVGEVYVISFTKQDEYVGTVYFINDNEFLSSPYLYLSDGDEAIDLGVISFSGGTALPEHEPAEQQDQDDDGIVDQSDSDDDNDTVDDSEDTDCDLDGIWDVLDADISQCEDDSAGDSTDTGDTTTSSDDGSSGGGTSSTVPAARVIEVSPTSNAGITDTLLGVALATSVQARFNCEIDTDTVSAQTFTIEDDVGSTISCAYSMSSNGKIVSCNHATDLFLVLTVYTATIDGIACEGGSSGDATTWSFKTVSLL